MLYSGGEWPGWLGSLHCNNFIYTYAALLPYGLRERDCTSLPSLAPTLPPKWRDAEGAGWGFVHGTGCTSGCTNTSSIAAVVVGHCKRVVPDWHCHRPTGPGGGGASPVTLGILLCQCSGEHLIAGDRPPCWLSRQSWAPVLPKSVATQISRLREATLGAHWSTSAKTLTRAA